MSTQSPRSMANVIALPTRPGGVPAAFANRANMPDMNAAAQQGIQAAFAVIGYKGRNWRIKYRGEDELLKDDRGVPMATLDVVIVGISQAISKQWYDKKYAEGDNEAPDCFSVNGIAPDRSSPKLQCATCAACPQNVWGSRVTDNGKKAKACADTRRIAVVPYGDEENETYGGPMLLRLPPTSLAGLARYGAELARFSAQPYMVRTQLGFDYDVAYPLLTFKAAGWLDDATCNTVNEILDNPLIERILETEVVEVTHDPAEPPSALAQGGPAKGFTAKAQPEPQPQPQPEPQTKAEASETAQPFARATVADELDEEAQLAAQLEAARAKKAAKSAANAQRFGEAAMANTPVATAATEAAPAAKKGGFGQKKAAPAPTAVQAQPAEAQATAAEPEPAETPRKSPEGDFAVPTATVQPAPADLETAIDALLA